MEFSCLQIIWFGLLGVLFIAYTLLDGFDLGVGAVLPHFKNDRSRRLALNAIGPLWDGNEVWLLTAGGALFAAFPHVYASVFSGLYTAQILLLGMLILRAVALEARSKVESQKWRSIWDWAFCVASTLIALLLGVAVGNLVIGLPIDGAGTIDAGWLGLFGLLEPIPLLAGVLAVCLLRLHGLLFLLVKIGDPEMRFETILRLPKEFAATVIFYLALTAWVVCDGAGTAGLAAHPWIGIFPLFAILSLLGTGIFLRAKTFKLAFAGTSATIAFLILTVGAGLFPNLVPASNATEAVNNSLTIAQSATETTLGIMLIVALIGVPIVLLYHFLIYRAFSKKLDAQSLDENSY